MTFPSDVELSQSSLFESSGKGENWRVYDLKKINAAISDLGRFDFTFKGKTYVYTLASLKGEAADKKAPEPNFAISAGYGQFKLSSIDATGSESKPVVRLEFLPHKIWRALGGGAEVESAVGLSSTPTSMTYIQASFYAHLRLKLTQLFEIHPRVYYVISNQNTGSGVGYQTNQVGAGLFALAHISATWQMHAEYMTEALGSQVIKSHDLIDISLIHSIGESARSYGGGAQMQSYKVVDAQNNVRNFTQTILYGLVGF